MENKLTNNVIESATLVGISAGVGFIGKKVFKTSVTPDPSTDFMNIVKWVAVLTVAIYARDYVIKEKLIPF